MKQSTLTLVKLTVLVPVDIFSSSMPNGIKQGGK